MFRRSVVIAIVSLAGLALPVARAQDEVFVRGKEKSIKGSVTEESARQVKVAGVKQLIRAPDVMDIVYEVSPIEVRLNLYRPAVQAEKDYNDRAKEANRKQHLADALEKYEEALGKLGAGQTFARRHIEYKLALLTARQAQEAGAPTDEAITKLKEFKSKHPDSWQITAAMRLLAGLLLGKGEFDEAEKTYQELAGFKVPEEVQHEAQLQAALINIRAGKPAAARTKLKNLIATLPAKSPYVVRAQIAEAEVQVAEKKFDEAVKTLRHIINETTDRGLKAAAYNTLGKSYFDAGKLKEARWEFLWVDVVYNQDPQEHAKALYYLAQIFDRLGEAERARECRQMLVSDRQFAGLDYQRRALQTSAKGSAKTP